MGRKSAVSMGIVMMCMAAIILFGQIKLSDHSAEGDNIQVQGMNLEKIQQDVDNLEEQGNITILNNDVFHELLNGQVMITQKAEENSAVTANENAQKEASEVEQVKEDVLQPSQDEINKLREEEAVEAVNIKNPALSVSATAAVLMNASSKEILYSKNALEEIQPASTVKLLTAITAVELCDEGEEFTVGSEINLIASDSSRAYLSKGQVLSLEQILDALLLPSGNDAAYVIAANLGRKIAGDDTLKAKAAVKQFLEVMNEKAYEIGVVHSNFLTPDGYDAEGQYTTAYDMALIGAKALEYDEILSTVNKVKTRDILLSGEDVTWYNSNKLIKEGSGYYYKYAVGLKTGTSGVAGRCLISAAMKENSQYVSVVMDASYEGRWQDSVDLLRYAVEQE